MYLVHMLELPDTRPKAYSMLSQGDFGRLKKGAVQRWMLTAHARASFVDRCRERASSHPQDEIKGHKESGSVRKRSDEEDVQKVMEVISQWRNPFETADDLVSLSSGSIASSALKEDLLKAEEKGKSTLVSFVQDRLTSSAVGFFETLPRLKLGKFGEVKKTVNQGGNSFVLRADRNLFARLLVIGQSRQIDLRDLLTHELGPVPWSLATYDGSLAKTNKSVLAKLLEDGVEILPNLTNASAVIVDAMAQLQALRRIPDRFIDHCYPQCSNQASRRSKEDRLCSRPVPKRLNKKY